MNKGITSLIVLTFLGMVGLYVLLYLAYQKYQQYAPTIQKATADLTAAQATGTSIFGAVASFLTPPASSSP